VTPEQQAYLDKAKRNLTAVRVLLADGDYDMVVSRAYYIMFYAATAMMLQKGKRFKKHSALMAAFATDWVRTGEVEAEYQRYFNNAFDMRNRADYDLGQEDTREDAEIRLARAEAFLAMAERILGGP
jgi:uncharacterized protein